MKRFLAALAMVESGNDSNAVGDGGMALGVYQIHRAYYIDARRQMVKEGTPASFFLGYDADVKNHFVAELLVRAYMRRYVPEAYESNEWEALARTHNGGPRGATNPNTLAYWLKVKTKMADGRGTK